MEDWLSERCPDCKQIIELYLSDFKKNCDHNGDMTIRCPACKIGKVKFHTELTQVEMYQKILE